MTSCNGSCVNEQTDAKNCGGCGATCIGTCASGLCSNVVVLGSTGANQPFVVPAGVTSIQVKLWGASGGESGSYVSGGGGFVWNPALTVTAGETLTVIVGGPGVDVVGVNAGGFGGGGEGGSNPLYTWGGSGGGRSAILRGTTELITAGGGGGTGYGGQSGNGVGGCGAVVNGKQNTPNGGNAGAGNGGAGQGGTTTAGGAGGTGSPAGGNGSLGQGGNAGPTGSEGAAAGGGGGYYGGGGGGEVFGGWSGAGGGGSCFGPAGTVFDGTGGTTDPDFGNNAGVPVTDGNGNPGRVVIRY
jgi:hypothetical protein